MKDYSNEINDLNIKLRDMQRATVKYLVKRLYDEDQRRMLVADEVGLGKTWVAKGVIAEGFRRWYDEGHKEDEHFNVFYICSNQQLASQNLKQLNFTKNKDCIVSRVNRISYLAYKPGHDDEPFHLYSLTPDTSFNLRSTQGTWEEREIIFSMLEESLDQDLIKNLSILLEGSKELNNWAPQGRSAQKRSELRSGIIKEYVEYLRRTEPDMDKFAECRKKYDLHECNTLWNLLKTVLPSFSKKDSKEIYDELIGMLKGALTDVCLSLMDPHIYVMDEFQRYGELLDGDSKDERSIIANKVFNQEGARILMLSATPFKAYTNSADEKEGEQHYRELKRVLAFLYAGSDIDWKSFEADRSRMYSLMMSLKDQQDRNNAIEEISRIKERLEEVYSRVMVRTEKIIASNDPNAMIRQSEDKPLPINRHEIEDFLNLDKIFTSVYGRLGERAPVPIDYAKSAPYAMSFLKNYKIAEKAASAGVKFNKNAFVNTDDINTYSFPEDKHWPNGKLHLLMKNMKQESKLLWCPPSMPYYRLEGAFRGMENFSKILVFSAWKLVPKMIATLVSYEAEKHTLGKLEIEVDDEEKGRKIINRDLKYFVDKRKSGKGDEARKPGRLLVFTNDRNNMTTLLLAYPSRYIAKLFKPMDAFKGRKDLRSIISEISSGLEKTIADTSNNCGSNEDKEHKHSFWALPLVLDKQQDNRWTYNLEAMVKEVRKDKKSSLATQYIPEMRDYLDPKKGYPEFPRTPSSKDNKAIADEMAWLSVGSPAICAFRSLKRYYENETEVLRSSFAIGKAFIDMFNKPESIAAVTLQYPGNKLGYWQKVLRYCADGNIQSMLDEYVFMLRNNYEDLEEITKAICRVLTTRTAYLKIDDASSIGIKDEKDKNHRHNLRTHYASAFGVVPVKYDSDDNRADNIRETFNSPFKPFVLATTSIGQEGLDFHWYCRKIMHWNLPNNPIDFEQREGRINRYRGKVIRQRVADIYSRSIEDTDLPWESMFKAAEEAKQKAKFPCDIVPNWHFDSDGVGIERIVPIYQFSEDLQRYSEMKRVLGIYRLAFGQPRQEELMEALTIKLSDDEMDKMLIDLCPLKKELKDKAKEEE